MPEWVPMMRTGGFAAQELEQIEQALVAGPVWRQSGV
jgi:hypothetical protein